MPELPEVEAARRRLSRKGLNREIRDAALCTPEIAEATARKHLEKALTGSRFTAVKRHGKVLFLCIGDGPWLVIHFGMTGEVALYEAPEDRPRHARLIIDFADGGHVAFDNPRKLGRLELTEDPSAHIEQQDLGPDALEIGRAAFARVVRGPRGMVKPALMDQKKIAGIGNEYSDEILFRAGLRPKADRGALSEDQLNALHDQMRKVLGAAADLRERGAALPDSWLMVHREKGARCPRCGGAVRHCKVSGRTAWFCPACQDTPDP